MNRGRAVLVVVVLAVVAATAAATGTFDRLFAASSTTSPTGAPSATVPVALGSNASPSASPSTTASPDRSSSGDLSPSASASPPGPSAPTSADGFSLRHTVVPMGFPLPAKPAHKYGARFRAPRVGVVYPYEEARGRTAGGTLLRAHDGVDILVPIGAPVFATFDGVVVDPAARWKPWDPSRYGKVIAIRSGETASLGYFSIAAHLSKLAVHLGDTVKRGELVGWTGSTGNAAGTTPHLHFELRAPFLIRQTWNGVTRRLDVFDPYPSLLAADPSH